MIFSLSYCCSFAQNLQNIDFFQHGDSLIINYDLIQESLDVYYDVRVLGLINKDVLYATSISGDISNIKPGKSKQIIWDIGADYKRVIGQLKIQIEITDKHYNYTFNTSTKTNIHMIDYNSKYLPCLSLLLPGLGSYVLNKHESFDMKFRRFILTSSSFLGCLSTAFYMNSRKNYQYAIYQHASHQGVIDESYKRAQMSNQIKQGSIVCAVIIMFSDVFYANQIQNGKPFNRFKLVLNDNFLPLLSLQIQIDNYEKWH